MPSAMVDATAATPPLDLTGRHRRRPAALCNSNSGCVAAATLSDANPNAGVAAAPKTKSKTVASRYLTPSSKPTYISSSAASPSPRPAAAAVASCGSAATTRRTLAVAFQSPTYSLETTRDRSGSPGAAAAAAAATPTPEKKRPGSTPGTAARAKVFDASQNTYRWPPRGGRDGRSALAAKSPERSAPSKKQSAAAAARPAALHGTPRRASVDGGTNEFLMALSSDDTDSASSSGGSGDGGAAPPRRSVVSGPPRPSPRSVASMTMMSSSARFTRDAIGTRSDRFAYPATPPAPAPVPVKKRSLFNGLLSSPFGRSSLKQPSPASKPVARSSFRRTASPSPARRSTEVPGSAGNMQGSAASSGCGFDRDMKLKPPAAIKSEEEHQLRLLYTQHLQWRLVNAQSGAALSLQTTVVEDCYAADIQSNS